MSERILILGGNGFIGGHLAAYYKSQGAAVHIADLKAHFHFDREQICDEFFKVDLRDEVTVEELFKYHYDIIYQLASDVGGAGYIFSGEHDAEIISNSAMINLNVAVHAARQRVNKLFFSSSSCAYPVPDGNYGYEKYFAEKLYQAHSKAYGIDIKIGRFQNVYGTHDTILSVKERFMTAICRKISEAEPGGEIEIWGDGSQRRSFIYVLDCINEIVSLMASIINHPVNIGYEQTVTINDVAKALIHISKKRLTIRNIFGDEFFDKYGYACPVGATDKEVSLLNTMGISVEGLKETYNWVNNKIHEY